MRGSRYVQVAALLLLAPICAEYLSAYDDSTGDVGALVSNLVLFVPLYGCPALLIREVARRRGLGWPGLLLLAAAFGLVQAGLVDQSLFSTDYRAIDGWEATFRATAVPGLGISAVNAVGFVTGHLIFSIGAPIALVEAARPGHVDQVWLGRPGLLLTAVGYAGASAVTLWWHLTTETSHASPTQLGVAAVIVVGLVVTAFRPRPRRGSGRPAPPVWVVGAIAALLAVGNGLAPETWLGVGLVIVTLAVGFGGLALGAATVGWSVRHVAAAAAAPLLVRALLAFTYDPLVGEVPETAQLGHHVAMVIIVLVVAAVALRRRREPVAIG